MELTRGGLLITKTRFDLEEIINKCWGITDELEILSEQLLDRTPGVPELDRDRMANILLGLQEVYALKFERLWDTFCQVCELDDYAPSSDAYDSWVESLYAHAEEFERNMKEINDEETTDDLGNSYSYSYSPRR